MCSRTRLKLDGVLSSSFGENIYKDEIAVIGHSFGAFTSIAVTIHGNDDTVDWQAPVVSSCYLVLEEHDRQWR